MTHSQRKAWTHASILLTAATCLAVASEPPDLERNPVSGFVESVDVDALSGHRVRHLVDRGSQGARTATFVSSGAGIAPRLAIREDGDTWVVWWRDASPDEIRYSRYDLSEGVWSVEEVLGEPGEAGRSPELVHDGSSTWVVYEADGEAGTTIIAVLAITDSPEPFGARVDVAATDFAGDPDAQLHVGAGHLWITWIDSLAEVGWSAYVRDTGHWDLPRYERYHDGSVRTALATVRQRIVGE